MSEQILKATHEGSLKFPGVEIPCFVLEDGTRLLSQSALQRSIGLSVGGGKGGVRRIESFLKNLLEKDININKLVARTNDPILFLPPHGGRSAYGYEATILADICDAVIGARKDKKLKLKSQFAIADRCEILLRSFAKVGIIALVDEATGYQEIRDKLALSAILDKYIRDEYRQWTQQFPPDFYKEMFRLRGWTYNEKSIKRPSIIGSYTNDIVYKRLAPGVLKELCDRNPSNEKGRRKQRHHQWLTDNIGIPKLREHIYGAIALMKASPNWGTFQRLLNRAYQRYGDTIEMDLEDEL